MRLPNRKPGKYTFPTFDPHMTAEKLQQLQDKLEHIQTVSLPRAVKETRQYGENGDYSENAEYQIAKGRLRGLLRAQDELQYQITHAEVIPAGGHGAGGGANATVGIGSTVTITANGNTNTFRILGSSETNPAAGVISYQSPIGNALLGHAVGDTITVPVGTGTVTYTITNMC